MFVLPENPFNVGRWLAVAVSNACYKTTGGGLAARGLVGVGKMERVTCELVRSSSVAYSATFPIVWHENRFFIKAKGKGSRRVRLFSFGKKND